MVQIIGYETHQNSEGKQFVTLTLQGDLLMKQSAQTGKLYATCRKCNILSTFNELTAAKLIGKEMPGTIEKVACEAYDITNPDTGEVKTLTERYEYVPEESISAMRVVHSSVAA